LLDDITGPATIMHAKFVKADTPEEMVRLAWSDIWEKIQRCGIGRELTLSKADPNKAALPTQERIIKLGERIYYGDTLSDQKAAPLEVDHEAIIARVIAEALKAPAKDRRIDDAYQLDGDL
jgi:hypothetical protein